MSSNTHDHERSEGEGDPNQNATLAHNVLCSCAECLNEGEDDPSVLGHVKAELEWVEILIGRITKGTDNSELLKYKKQIEERVKLLSKS